ncbi:MAG: SLC13 family permease [Anaerolineae bacterium]|jgi:di/tricarboxylate transporter|nr:SLC13 family permease [Anaerolineae bacterium]MBT4311963.1 SLC13 family permease [Anaerolineae bacterium]MBT4459363.1 SLC13 family permease [Anaerolineae bacterium]MBT4841265.1 SLC13 family permease [Anaerolineae bacterium]MBT6060557.1 SLC13 family permease [Anaerolineae bacterium]
MTTQMLITLGILAFAILFFITEWLRVDVVALIVVITLMVTKLLTPSEAIAGFSSPVVLTIASLFVIGGAILQTGLAASIGRQILKVAGGGQASLMTAVMLTVAILSAFMSDTGTVAVLLPAVISMASSIQLSPSKLLIPLSFGALLGGSATLIGTPPNIIVSDLLHENGLEPFQFFDYSPIGLILIASGILFMVTIGKKMLPDRARTRGLLRFETPEEIAERYRLPDNLYRLRVRAASTLVGKSIAEADLGARFNITVLEIRRKPEARTMVKLGETSLVWQADKAKGMKPSVETTFQPNDLLIIQGETTDITHLAASWNLGVQPAKRADEHAISNEEVGIAEVLLPQRSRLVGKTLTDLSFGRIYRLTVLGIQRPSVKETLNLKTTPLQFGDILLVQGSWENILSLRKKRRDFVVMGHPEEMQGPPQKDKAPLAGIILLGMLIMMVGEFMPLTTSSMLAAVLMILTGCLTIDEAYNFINWKSIVLVAGMLPMSAALVSVGLIDLLASNLTIALGALSPIWVIGGLFITTSIFTQVLSNTATAVLIAPLAFAIAQNLGIQPHALLMSVAIAASMAFASPVASPVNTLVMGAGNYRFSDYMKIGAPMILISMAITMLVLPLLWPF